MRRGKVFKVKGHNGWRGQKQINKTRFVKDFVGTKAECEAQCGEWLEMLENTYRNHWDGTLSWGQFKIKWREWATLETTAKEPMSRQSIKKYNLIFQTLERLIKPRYVRDITMQKLRYCRSILEQEAVKKGQDNHGVNHFVSCMRAAIKWGIDSGYMPEMDIENFHKVPTAKVVVKTNSISEIETLIKYGSLKERIIVSLPMWMGNRSAESRSTTSRNRTSLKYDRLDAPLRAFVSGERSCNPRACDDDCLWRRHRFGAFAAPNESTAAFADAFPTRAKPAILEAKELRPSMQPPLPKRNILRIGR